MPPVLPAVGTLPVLRWPRWNDVRGVALGIKGRNSECFGQTTNTHPPLGPAGPLSYAGPRGGWPYYVGVLLNALVSRAWYYLRPAEGPTDTGRFFSPPSLHPPPRGLGLISRARNGARRWHPVSVMESYKEANRPPPRTLRHSPSSLLTNN